MFLLISSVAHDTMSVNKEMGKSLALHLKNGEINRNAVREKEGAGQMKNWIHKGLAATDRKRRK